MASKSSAGRSFGPVFLRICLGVIFIYAGLAKILPTAEVSGADVTALKAMGVTPKNAPEDADKLEVSMAYTLALHLQKSATLTEKGMRLWPEALAKGRWPVYAAYACVLTELVGGALVLLGALTRLSALGLAFTMLMAMWLTQFGPAIQSGDTHLGFLPGHDVWDTSGAWQTLMLQFSLLCSALCLVWTGCGSLGVDRVLFPKSGGAPKPKAEPAQ